MIFDKAINIALAISTACHCLLILQVPRTRLHPPLKPIHKLEVTYYQIKGKSKALPMAMRPPQIKKSTQQRPFIAKAVKPRAEASSVKIKPHKEKIARSIPKEKSPPKKEVVSVKKVDPQDEKTPLDIPSHLAEDPAYLDYYQTVREKIRQIANRNCPRFFADGEVHLTFVLLPNGSLKTTRIVEQKSSGNNRLRNVALQSIRESSPFTPFPEEIDLPQLSFNLVISYQKKK